MDGLFVSHLGPTLPSPSRSASLIISSISSPDRSWNRLTLSTVPSLVPSLAKLWFQFTSVSESWTNVAANGTWDTAKRGSSVCNQLWQYIGNIFCKLFNLKQSSELSLTSALVSAPNTKWLQTCDSKRPHLPKGHHYSLQLSSRDEPEERKLIIIQNLFFEFFVVVEHFWTKLLTRPRPGRTLWRRPWHPPRSRSPPSSSSSSPGTPGTRCCPTRPHPPKVWDKPVGLEDFYFWYLYDS